MKHEKKQMNYYIIITTFNIMRNKLIENSKCQSGLDNKWNYDNCMQEMSIHCCVLRAKLICFVVEDVVFANAGLR